jgi:hypothetical protein
VKKKLAALVVFFALIALAGVLLPAGWLKAQVGGVTTVVGGQTGTNLLPVATATGAGGAVTNPAANFVVQVAGGPIYFGGSEQIVASQQLTLPASSTNLLVWNGFSEQVYNKQAVTGPGSSGVGIPAAVLYADPGRGELALATVVCNATACGNGGNGSITDNRSVSNFPAGLAVPSSTFANLPTTHVAGTLLLCTSCATPASAMATCTSGANAILAIDSGSAWNCF